MSTHPLFSISFRVFFLLTTLIAILNPTFWISDYSGHLEFNSHVTSLFWHGHEMLFAFTSALLAGFLFTASANWTGTKPYRGKVLAALAIIWLIERVSYFLPISQDTLLILMNIFLPSVIFLLFFKLKNHARQLYVFIPFLIALFATKFLHSYAYFKGNQEYMEMSITSGVALIRLVVFLIAGRVLPFFTNKRLPNANINISGNFHIFALLPLLLLTIPLPSNFPKYLLAVIYAVAIIGNAIRNYKLFSKLVLSVPLLWIIHLGINFMLLALIFAGASLFIDGLDNTREIVHMTMAGGLGLIAIGFMCRVSLGHTGRKIKADVWHITAFLSVLLGALIRVITPGLFPEIYESSLHYASGFWTFGFCIHFYKFAKIWYGPRPDGKAY